jgi:flagellum-specific peptidoglycan hydrolase FlgJ
MIFSLQHLIEALRNELQQYGEMLALLDHQNDLVAAQDSDEVLDSINAIDSQGAAIQTARNNRQLAQRELAENLKQSSQANFAQIIPLIPAQYRPLVSALVQENNETLLRVRQRAQENHALLRHSLNKMQRFLTSLSPQAQEPSTANHQDGDCALMVEAGSPFYQAIV